MSKTTEREDRSHDEATAALFKMDPAFASAYLNHVLEDGDWAEVLIALRQMSKAGFTSRRRAMFRK